MKPKRLFLGVIVLLVTGVIYWLGSGGGTRSPVVEPGAASDPTLAAGPGKTTIASEAARPPSATAVPPAPGGVMPPPPGDAPAPSVDDLPAPGATEPGTLQPGRLRADIEDVQFALRDFRTGLGGNPVGNNAEITKALLGDNVKQIKIPVPTGSQINDRGELCDRLGTPYFFHQVSAIQMEVRSAGPDRKMWTADDVQR